MSAAAGAGLAFPALRRFPQADWHAWRVNGDRVNAHLTALSEFGKNP